MNYELAYSLAFQRLTFHIPHAAMQLLCDAGSAENIYAHHHNINDIVPNANQNVSKLLNVNWEPYLAWAEQEIAWCEKNKIRILVAGTPEYPQRLLNCNDAPVVLYYLGNADLNAEHIISVVGTRQSTPYGHDMLHRIITDLKTLVPDVLIVSGLAYGIDVCSHKEAMAASLPTVGIVAHGLDTLYPAAHRSIAVQMVKHGGLLSEYTSKTKGDRQNFLRRNRIVAGICDCVIVAESMEHGGSLVTARIANDYNRTVFAIPGRITDKASEGCNNLISNSKAYMLTSAHDIIKIMGWQTADEQTAIRAAGIQTSMFNSLSPDEQLITDTLKDEDLQRNVIAQKTGLPINTVSSILFELEMKGIVKQFAGATYHFVNA